MPVFQRRKFQIIFPCPTKKEHDCAVEKSFCDIESINMCCDFQDPFFNFIIYSFLSKRILPIIIIWKVEMFSPPRLFSHHHLKCCFSTFVVCAIFYSKYLTNPIKAWRTKLFEISFCVVNRLMPLHFWKNNLFLWSNFVQDNYIVADEN